MTSDRIATAVRPRPRGFIENWRPQAKTRALLEQVDAVLKTYGTAMAVRQIFYALVVGYAFPKVELAYARLLEALNRARRAGRIPFEAIREEGAVVYSAPGIDSVAELESTVDYLLTSSEVNPSTGQPVKLLVFVEAAGMAEQIAEIAGPFGADVVGSSGFDSLTVKRNLAKTAAGRPVVVLHAGDHDPSGAHLYQSLCEDVEAFVAALGGAVTFRRVAVLPEHIERYSLPTAPPKATDRRAFDGQTVQCEALPPDVLADLVREACEEHFDHGIYEAERARFEAGRDALRWRMMGGV